MYGNIGRIHFVGIGGIGMSGIAEVLLNLGYEVSGSDLRLNDTTERLARLGGLIFQGHRPEHVAAASVVVTSSAVKDDNLEVRRALERRVPVIPRAEMLAELMRMKYGIAVAGTHGKTTTTSMLATTLHAAGIDPTAVIGGQLNAFESNAKLGQGRFMVAEADESDGSFMHLAPSIAIVTNIDNDHLDHYGSMEAIRQTFVDFLQKIPFYGLAVVCADDPQVSRILPQLNKRLCRYGFSADADLRACQLRTSGQGCCFEVWQKDQYLGEVALQVPGRHNVLNALATIAVALELGVGFPETAAALAAFQGVQRRFQRYYSGPEGVVVDDYAHHPREIEATLEAARSSAGKQRLTAVFQPHRYSRTALLFDEFVHAFKEADMVCVVDIYAAGEDPRPGVTSSKLVQAMRQAGYNNVCYIPDKNSVPPWLEHYQQRGDWILTLGAGDIWQLAQDLGAHWAREAVHGSVNELASPVSALGG